MTFSTSKFHEIVPMRPSFDSGDRAWAFASACSFVMPCFIDCATSCLLCICAATTGFAMVCASAPFGICGALCNFLTSASIWPLYGCSESVWPAGAFRTIWPLTCLSAALASGKSSFCISAALSDGMPGMVNSLDIGLLLAAAKPPTARIAMSQPTRKNGHFL